MEPEVQQIGDSRVASTTNQSPIPEVERWLASYLVEQTQHLARECDRDPTLLLTQEMGLLDQDLKRWRQWASRLLTHEIVATQQALEKENKTVLYLFKWERTLPRGLAECLQGVLQKQLELLGYKVHPALRALVVRREVMPCLEHMFPDGYYTAIDELGEEQMDCLFEKLVVGDNRLYSKSDAALLSTVMEAQRRGKPYASFTIMRRENGFTCLLTQTH